MLARRKFDSRVASGLFQKVYDFITLADYERAKEEASARIVHRQSRGNVAVQDGWYMTKGKLSKISKRADKAMTSLRKAIRS